MKIKLYLRKWGLLNKIDSSLSTLLFRLLYKLFLSDLYLVRFMIFRGVKIIGTKSL